MERARDRRGRRSRRLAVLLAAALLPSPAAASTPGPEGRSPLAIPQVPYLPQTTALCGGAALAMVLRYWGAAGVRPEDFAPALLPSGRGITTGTLARLAEERGYEARPFRGDPAEAAAQLEKGRPLIALSGDAAGSSGHYVVLLAWANRRVLLHDPAVGPFRVMAEKEWLERWTAAERWTLLVLPGPRREEPSRDAAQTSRQDDPCAALVGPAVQKADQGDLDSARRDLTAAAELCPPSPAPLREMGGLEFRRGDWAAAAALAERAVARRPDDSLSWRLLATSRFLEGQSEEALEAWNQVGEPKLDLVSIDGLERTPFRTVYDSLGAGPDDVLTPPLLLRARRRVDALPAAEGSRVSYRPLPQGRARLEVAIVERPTVDPLRPLLVESALRAFTDHQVGLSLANLTQTGDRGRVVWRWQSNRPQVSIAAAAPHALGLPGVVTAEALWDEQSYRIPPGGEGAVVRETRKKASLSVEDWWWADTKAGATVGVDEWSDRGSYVSIAAHLDHRLAGDRVSIGGRLAGWAGPSGPPFHTHALRVSARSRATGGRSPVLRLDVAYEGASSRAPLALWSGAGTGLGRDLLLRAHPLLRDGIVDSRCFGRDVLRAGLEGEAAVASLGPLGLDAAMFVDSAQVLAPLPGSSSRPGFVDLGAGLRVRLPGRRFSLRVDVATPWGRIRPHLSVGWQTQWPE